MPDPVIDPLDFATAGAAAAGQQAAAQQAAPPVDQTAADAAVGAALGTGTGGAAGAVMPEQVQVSPVLAWMQDQFDIQGLESEEDLREQLDAELNRADLVRRTFGDDFDEERARQLQEAATRYQQIAPELEAFNQWKQQRLGLQVGQTGQPGALQPAAPQPTTQFTPIEPPARELYSLVQQAPDGTFKPSVPTSQAHIAAADAITAYERQRRSRAEQLLSNPFAIVEQHPQWQQFVAWQKQVQQQLDQQKLEMQARQESDLFFQRHGQSLSEQDPATGQAKWNRTGEVFIRLLDNNLAAGMASKDAHEKALALAQEIAPIAGRQAAPATGGNGQPKTKSAGFVRNGLSRSQRQPRASDHAAGAPPARVPGEIEPDVLSDDAMFEASKARAMAEAGMT